MNKKKKMEFKGTDFIIETNYSPAAKKHEKLRITLRNKKRVIEMLSGDIILAIINSYRKEIASPFAFHNKVHPMVDVERTITMENQLYDKDGNEVPKSFNFIHPMTLESAIVEKARGLCDFPMEYFNLTNEMLDEAQKCVQDEINKINAMKNPIPTEAPIESPYQDEELLTSE